MRIPNHNSKAFFFLILCAAGALAAGCALPLGEDYILERNNAKDALVIANYDLQVYVPVPVAGAAPVTVLSRGDMDVQAVWKDAGGGDITASLSSFAMGEVYQADITVTAKNGWSFDPGINFQYPPGSVTVQPGADADPSLRVLTTVTYRPAETARIIDQGNLSPYIPPPALGATPVISFGGAQYTGTVAWIDGLGSPVGLFQGGIIYTAEVTLAAAPGYVFGPSPEFYHTGDSLEPDPAALPFTAASGNSGGTLSIPFPQTRTGAEIGVPLDLTDLIPAPHAGGRPVTSFISPTLAYSGKVIWTDKSGVPLDGKVFQYGETYTAAAELTAAPGFVFPPALTAANFIHLYDDEPGHPPAYIPGGGGAGTVTVTFPAAGSYTVVNEYDLAAYIPLPVAGIAPVWTFDHNGVTGTVSWDYYAAQGGWTAMSLLEVFHCDTIYRAEITLRAQTGYRFDPARKFGYSSGVYWPLDAPQTGTESRDITVIYEEFTGSFASETTPGSALKRIRAARNDYTSEAAPLYVDISPGTEPVELTSGSLETTGAVLEYPSKSPAHIRIDGRGRTLELTGFPTRSAVITVGSGVTLYLRNITLKGIGNNTAPLITVDGGKLVLEDGVVVQGNTNVYSSSNAGGGIRVSNNGILLMKGGKISGNAADYGGGGVYVSSGTFTMEAGEISGNTADSSSYGGNGGSGGGVYVSGGTFFTMKGGKISGNTASINFGGGVYVFGGTFTMEAGEISDNSSTYGGGVSNDGGTFTMKAGEISDNSANNGGGVYNNNSGTFKMEAGEISANTANYYGGGVYNNTSGTFKMEAGEISDNSANNGGGCGGGGVFNAKATFTMEGGEISGNTVGNYYYGAGGGVYVSTGTFTKTGGIIYGDDDTTHTLGSKENTAALGGHAIYLVSGNVLNTEAGTGLLLYAQRSTSSDSWIYTNGVILDNW
jgi:hypothetical protein